MRVGDSLPFNDYSGDPVSFPLTMWTGEILKSDPVLLASPPIENRSGPFFFVNSSSARATTLEKVESPLQLLGSVLLNISSSGVNERK